jgi:hypothetical protein
VITGIPVLAQGSCTVARISGRQGGGCPQRDSNPPSPEIIVPEERLPMNYEAA